MKRVTIKDAPHFLNMNDKAFWVLGYNEALDAGVQEVALTAFVALLDKALQHAKASHALRDRSDRENTQPEYDRAAAARQAVIDCYAAGVVLLPPGELTEDEWWAAAVEDKAAAGVGEVPE